MYIIDQWVPLPEVPPTEIILLLLVDNILDAECTTPLRVEILIAEVRVVLAVAKHRGDQLFVKLLD